MNDKWKRSVIYQIYPKSFYDSNGDGFGDIPGITEKLNYLKNLGIDIIWLCPVYASPQDDNGYDISDYRSIYSRFGTLDDMKKLINESHKMGIGIMMDLVVNHTSDEHNWFVESRKSRDNPYRNFYIWKDPKGFDEQGRPVPPNNWGSFFSGSAWEWDETTEQFYLHLFSKKQPDLNWENENVRHEIYDMMRWWMDIGIDGWRMDTCSLYSKDMSFPDYPACNSGYAISPYFGHGPKIHDYIKEMNREVFSRYDCITVGEASFATIEDGILYTGYDRKELDMIFTFEHMDADLKKDSPYGKWEINSPDLPRLKKVFERWQKGLYNIGWNSLYWNNHDQPRIVSRWGNDGEYRVKSAKMLSGVLHMMQGTPFIYQGEEIGMTNCSLALDECNDIEIHNAFTEMVLEKKLMSKDEFINAVYKRGRDNSRTPFQWNDSKNGGFSTGTPWLKVNPNYKFINAENDLKSDDSLYLWYKKLIKLRKELDIITDGDFNLIYPDDKEIFAYKRESSKQKMYVLGNFSEKTREIRIDEDLKAYRILLANYSERVEVSNLITIRPWEIIALIGDKNYENENGNI